ncbi:MAG: hypothetical protein IJM67_06410 [Atopobiaceae bacterium]|nr:hypothetical protein [Atopobiaceae bacterium]
MADLITMLTWHDVTVPNAKEVFLSAADAPCKHWGFKIEGTTPESFADLAATMKEHGKEVYIEVLAMSEEDCIKAAEQCIAGGAQHMLGTPYYPSVQKMLDEAGVTYSPFPALDPDSRMRKPIPEVVDCAMGFERTGCDGFTISAYRYLGGEPEELLRALDDATEMPFRIAGSINSYERLDFVKSLKNLTGFTIGGAFFENKFGETFAENVTEVCEYLKK